MKLFRSCASFALLALGVSQAANAYVVNGSNFTNYVQSQTFNGNATFEARRNDALNANATFLKKSQAGYTGVGVTNGRTNGELDIGETISGTFTNNMQINSFTLGLLFDGPEYGDVNEVATVSIFNGSSWLMGSLVALNTNTASWSFGGNTTNITAISSASNGLGGVWRIDNPFATTIGSKIVFGASYGVCGSAGGACNNQSDYTINQVDYASVPEPSALALLAVGMIGLSIARRRTRKG